MPRPRTSIVIVSYNGLSETTAPCLESIFSVSGDGDFEVVVVDNNSSDDTVPRLKDFMAAEPRLKCVFNSTNRGFAGGNNDGIRIASGEYLVLLNSDCIVSDRWLETLTAPLSGDVSIGMTGPVSNSVGNEQKIFTAGSTPEEIMREGHSWTAMSRGSSFETPRLVFFCVAMRMDLALEVGPLDEGFGIGFYEDDDYCTRVAQTGRRLVCCEDVFIYHRGGGSFEQSGFSTRKLLRENRAVFVKKHGLPPQTRHARDRQLDVIEGYLRAQSDVGMGYRIENRLRLVETMLPRGMLKRYLFRKRLERLKSQIRKCGIALK